MAAEEPDDSPGKVSAGGLRSRLLPVPARWDHTARVARGRERHMTGTGSRDEIRERLDEMLDAMNCGDAPRLRTMLSERPGTVHIGTDAGEWWSSG